MHFGCKDFYWSQVWEQIHVSYLHFFSLAGEGSNLQPPDPKSGVLPVELPAKVSLVGRSARPSTLYELDAIAERVVDVAATDFGNLVVESYLVTCRVQHLA